MFVSPILTLYKNFQTGPQYINKLQKKIFGHNIRYFSSSQACLWRILFFGNDAFSLQSLKMLKSQQESNLITQLEVVTSAGREDPLLEYCIANEIVYHKWPLQSCEILDYDLGAVVSFGFLIPKSVITTFPLGMINIHASLLPRWRGASPISHAILHGDTETGITVMKIEPHRFDVGDIISQRGTSIKEDDTFTSLFQRLSVIGASELVECIKNLPQCLENAKPQNTEGVTYAPKLTKTMAELNFETMDAGTIFALERAISHLFPLTTCWWGTPVRLYSIIPSDYPLSSESPRPGRIYYCRRAKTVFIECFNRSFISFSKIVLNRRAPMDGRDFYNGFLSKKPENQWIFNPAIEK